jgi:glycosyltransferase involved in cell wall biosynthesis
MFNDWKVSVVIPAYNEEATIADVVRDFRGHPNVDEVLVVDNNCRDRTSELATAAGARVIAESAKGYGCALRRGMDEAVGDVFVLVEADGSFKAHDLTKFLCYLPDCGMVLGTRTTRQMVQQGANMDSLLRWGNVVAAKILELFWFLSSEPRITDVGCTYRAVHRSAWSLMRPGLTESGAPFSPEMICEAFRCGIRVIEIPVHYFARGGGESKHSKGFVQVARTGLRMLRTIVRKRLSGSVTPERRAQAAALGARSWSPQS